MTTGILYGIGVGPGDPTLMTIKAVETIRACPVIAAPRTRNGNMVALDIAKQTVDLADKTVVPLDFAMSHDQAVRVSSHHKAAGIVREHLDAGRSVALLNLGDISIYASFRYIADLLQPEGYRIEMVPGVPSFCAAASRLGETLTDMDTPLRIMPDADNNVDSQINLPGTTVWMKSGKRLATLLEKLSSHGVLTKSVIVQNCGMANERIFRQPRVDEINNDYFTLVILKTGE